MNIEQKLEVVERSVQYGCLSCDLQPGSKAKILEALKEIGLPPEEVDEFTCNTTQLSRPGSYILVGCATRKQLISSIGKLLVQKEVDRLTANLARAEYK